MCIFFLQLMDYEPRAREQVPLLLDLGQEVPALLKAMESGDTDLIYTVLLRMHVKMPLAEFYVCIYMFVCAAYLILICSQLNYLFLTISLKFVTILWPKLYTSSTAMRTTPKNSMISIPKSLILMLKQLCI